MTDDVELCEIAIGTPPFTDCSQTAVANVTAGCVHEHLKTRSVCAECVEWFKAEDMCCFECYERDEHLCVAAVIRIELLSG